MRILTPSVWKFVPSGAATFALLAAALLMLGAACGCDSGTPTVTPAFSLPMALPSPKAALAPGSGAEATAARTSDYWIGPRTWEPEDVSGLGTSHAGTGRSALPARARAGL